jgi:hypothetical protein
MIKIVLPLLAAAGLAGAAPAPAPQEGANPAVPGKVAVPKACQNTIELVRTANGLGPVERRPASAERPLLTAAVDYRIDGCRVLMMANNPRDIRPLPEFSGEARMMPAR